jgi:hypothetical protein
MNNESPATVGEEKTQPRVSNCQRMAGSDEFRCCISVGFICAQQELTRNSNSKQIEKPE